MRRDTQHVLLLLLGGALLRISADETYLRYVLPSHRWLLIAAGAAVVALAVWGAVRDHLPSHHLLDRGDGPGEQADHGAEHGRAERYSPWLLLLPVLVIALVAPPALGADAVTRIGTQGAAVRTADVFAPLPAGAAPGLTMGEFVQRAMFDTTGSLDRREVTLTGFAVRRGPETDLARLTIFCCAADARVNRVRLIGDLGAVGGLASDTWLRVRVVVVPGSATAAAHYVPSATVTGFQEIAAPGDPYEY